MEAAHGIQAKRPVVEHARMGARVEAAAWVAVAVTKAMVLAAVQAQVHSPAGVVAPAVRAVPAAENDKIVALAD